MSNRGSHAKWVATCKIGMYVDRGIEAHRAGLKAEAHTRFMKSLHEGRRGNVPSPMAAIQMGLKMAAAVKEEHDIQKAIQASLVQDEKTDS